jgi:uncharacterized protein YaiE (UPF0345 family)
MTVVSGILTVQLPDSEQWVDYKAGESFEVPAGVVFSVKTDTDTAYLCTYA